MGTCQTYSEKHDKNGSSQSDRFLPALRSDYFLLEERDEKHFIFFAQKLSAYINFYKENNEVDGDWTTFFSNDSTSILIYIANWQTAIYENNYTALKKNASVTFPCITIQCLVEKIESEFLSILSQSSKLDEVISVKENILSLADLIIKKINFIKDEIDRSSNTETLINNYNFDKNMQQLFGMLLSWKDLSDQTIENQLTNYDQHSPHFTLFLTFLKLLNTAKDQQNNFTRRHLDFYYKEVLKTALQKAKPDFIHLIVESKSQNAFILPKKTIFQAGKNTLGQPKFYESISDYTINNIKVNSVFSIFDSTKSKFKSDLLPNLNKDKGFQIFSENSTFYNEGIAIASPLLLMKNGDRTIKIEFNTNKYNATNFDYFLTGEKNWIKIENPLNDGNFIELKLSAKEKSIVPFDIEIHTDFSLESSYPVLLIIPKNSEVITSISTITLNIKVENNKSFLLESDFGTIDTEKPFYPFGELPKKGNGITFSSNEYFIKKNAVAKFTILDDANSPTYFKNFTSTSILNNSVYQVKNANNLSNTYPISDYEIQKLPDANTLFFGKFRIEFTDPNYDQESYLQNYLSATKNILDAVNPPTTLPKKPHIKQFTFGYEVTEKINLASRTGENNPIEVYKILPFGFQKLEKEILKFSSFENLKGNIFVGFQDAKAKDAFSFLIQLEEGTANPKLAPAKISWEFLSKNTWMDFPVQFIQDDTQSLSQSGLVNIVLPEFDPLSNSVLPKDIFWIKISVSDVNAVCNLVGIHSQAIKASFSNAVDQTAEFTENTAKGTISKTFAFNNNIKKIEQPYSSFGGKLNEKDETLYLRTSERLRHKNRAITIWDYERLILQEFPEVYSVKCLNHYRYDSEISNVSAGYVTIIPIAKSNVVENIYWKPLLSLSSMTKIKDFLKKIASPHARICVKTPVLEKIELSFKVKLIKSAGMDSSLYINELKETINVFLSPWSVENEEVQFVNTIEFSSLIQLIDNQYFVDYITDFTVLQYLLNDNFQTENSPIKSKYQISPRTDFSLFIPNDYHIITEIL